MKLFISIDVPQNLYRYCKQLQDQFPDIRKTDQFHITLQFLGNDIKSEKPIIDSLKKIKFAPFEIEMGDAMPFGDTNNPKGIWIECKNNDILKKLSEDIRHVMRPLGFTSDLPFRPHITLGRYKDTPQIKPKIIKGKPYKFLIDTFYLTKSTLTPSGPIHERIAKF